MPDVQPFAEANSSDLQRHGLHALILEALRQSDYLVVVCSERAVTPNAEGKLWVDGNVAKTRRKYDAYSQETEEWSYQNAGTAVTIRKAGAGGGSFAVLKKSALNDNARTQVAGYRYETDAAGRAKNVFFCDLAGFTILDEFGTLGKQFTYDTNGHIAETRFWVIDDISGEKIGTRSDGVAAIKTAYDADGNLVSVAYEDADGKPIFIKSGYAKMLQKFENGNCVERAFYDEKGKTALTKKVMQLFEVDMMLSEIVLSLLISMRRERRV